MARWKRTLITICMVILIVTLGFGILFWVLEGRLVKSTEGKWSLVLHQTKEDLEEPLMEHSITIRGEDTAEVSMYETAGIRLASSNAGELLQHFLVRKDDLVAVYDCTGVLENLSQLDGELDLDQLYADICAQVGENMTFFLEDYEQ